LLTSDRYIAIYKVLLYSLDSVPSPAIHHGMYIPKYLFNISLAEFYSTQYFSTQYTMDLEYFEYLNSTGKRRLRVKAPEPTSKYQDDFSG